MESCSSSSPSLSVGIKRTTFLRGHQVDFVTGRAELDEYEIAYAEERETVLAKGLSIQGKVLEKLF